MRLEDAYLQALASQFESDQVPETASTKGTSFAEKATEDLTFGEFARSMLDAAAVTTKGAVQGSVGLPGDIEGLVRTLGNAVGLNVSEDTVLPTAEEVRAFFDKYVPIKPEQAARMQPEARKTVETVGEVVSPLGPIAGAKQIAKGAKRVLDATKDLPVGLSIKDVSQVKLADDLVVDIAPAERSKNFKNWFGDSKIVDDKGKPMVMYHGTPADFEEFGAGPRQAIFFSSDPKFASGYAGDQKTRGAMARPNVMPVYIKASNPFDYSNPEHVKKVQDLIKPTGDEYFDGPVKDLATGDWAIIELKRVQEAIKQAGFDAFYVMEDGVKNIGVFDPKQIKSAIGNKGTFNPNDPNILRGAAVAPAAPAAMQDKENK